MVDEAGVRDSALESAPRDVEPAGLVREFLPLERRRVRGNPPLDLVEIAHWEELRDLLEIALGAVPPRPGESRRRALRVRTHLKVLVTNSLAQELLHVHDLSDQGVFLRTQRPLPAGSMLQIELQERHGRALELEGTVVWIREIAEGHGPCGMAVALHALSDRDRAVLAELVESTLVVLD